MLNCAVGSVVDQVDLAPILFKRLQIQGTTLRSRSAAYQADLIERFKYTVADKLTGEKGPGPLRTYIHSVYPFEKIQDAHRDMESNTTAGKIIVTI